MPSNDDPTSDSKLLRTWFEFIAARIMRSVLTSSVEQPVGTAVAVGICVGAISNSMLGFGLGILAAYIFHRAILAGITASDRS